MRVSYTDEYYVQLPERHAFPMGKFPALYDILLKEGVIRSSDAVEPRQADWSDLLLVHSSAYLEALRTGTLGAKAERRMGLPWSEALVRRSRLAVQGTVNASFMSLEDGLAANLAGGTHHAFRDYGEGFCVLNDVCVAIRMLIRSKWIKKALVIDLDVHQGNGNAAVLEPHEAFTFSMHGARNFPFRKETSSLDVPLPDGTGDEAYLAALEESLDRIQKEVDPDIVFYLAGIDVRAGDRFGRLELSRAGIEERDRMVLERIRDWDRPLTLLLSGGYAESPELTADLHAIAHRQARRIYSGQLPVTTRSRPARS